MKYQSNYKPTLEYLEFSISDHCNLSCKGCAHFSPLAKPHFIDLYKYKKDLKRLHELFHNIKLIRILGGEPLLNEKITTIVKLARDYFPKSTIHIVTNGILLEKMDVYFWQCLRENFVDIDISLYPPYFNKRNTYENICKANEIKVNITQKHFFSKILQPDGISDPNQTFSKCCFKVCTYLENGKISACSLPNTVHILNTYYGYKISENGNCNIHDEYVTGEYILQFLNKSTETCKYCSATPKKFNWDYSKRNEDEWCL